MNGAEHHGARKRADADRFCAEALSDEWDALFAKQDEIRARAEAMRARNDRRQKFVRWGAYLFVLAVIAIHPSPAVFTAAFAANVAVFTVDLAMFFASERRANRIDDEARALWPAIRRVARALDTVAPRTPPRDDASAQLPN